MGVERPAAGVAVNAPPISKVQRSKGTVRHWLRAYEPKTRSGTRIAKVRQARDDGRCEVGLICPTHGPSGFVIEGCSYYRCRRCRAESVARHRRRWKRILARDAGGSGRLCGYDRCLTALEFHHLEPGTKRIGISQRGLTMSLEALRFEAANCVLLGSNYLAEVENGMATVALKCRGEPDSREALWIHRMRGSSMAERTAVNR